MTIEEKDIRDVFFENIRKIFLKRNDFYILTNDADVFALEKIKNHKRFIDAGVCEQNLINIASGLARRGKKVLVYGFCNFLCHRSFEQIKINICSMRLPVYIVGIGPGFSFPYDGPTHHGVQDIANMYTIPELQIVNLSENSLANFYSKNILANKEPVYFRLDKGVMNSNNLNYNFKQGFNLTKSKKKKKLIITSGYFARVTEKMLYQKNINDTCVLDFYNFKKFNLLKLSNILKSYQKVLLYDENTQSGGFSFIVNDIVCKNNIKYNQFKSLCSPERQIFIYRQDRDSLLKDLKIDKNSLFQTLKKL
jgi:transketolase